MFNCKKYPILEFVNGSLVFEADEMQCKLKHFDLAKGLLNILKYAN